MADTMALPPQREYPRNLRSVVSRLVGFHRNQFRLESVSTQTVGSNRRIIVNLPADAIIDLESFAWHLTATAPAQQATGAASTAAAVSPAICAGVPRVQDLIARVQVFCNGIQISSGCAEYNTAFRLKLVNESTLAKDQSVGSAVEGARLNTANENATVLAALGDSYTVVDDVRRLTVQNWTGIVGGECSTRFLNTALVGQISVHITTAPDAVLHTMPAAQDATTTRFIPIDSFVPNDFGTGAVGSVTYSGQYTIDDFHFSVDTVSIDDGWFSATMQDKLEKEGVLEYAYKEYYSFSNDIGTASAQTSRWSLSSQSIDKVFGTMRQSGYQSFKTWTDANAGPLETTAWQYLYMLNDERTYTAGTVADGVCSGAAGLMEAPTTQFLQPWMRLQSFRAAAADGTSLNTFNSVMSLNNVNHPQSQALLAQQLANCSLYGEKQEMRSTGNLVTCDGESTGRNYQAAAAPAGRVKFGPAGYVDGVYHTVARFNHPEANDSPMSVYRISGFDSRGSQAMGTWTVSGMENEKQKSVYILAETTATLKVGAGKSILVEW